MPKHFRATHKQSGEVVEFDLGDIYSNGWISYYPTGYIYIATGRAVPDRLTTENYIDWDDNEYQDNYPTENWSLKHWLKDYHLQYLHRDTAGNGEYHDYEEGRE